MKPTLKLSQQALILVSVPLVFQLLFIGVLVYLLALSEREAAVLDHSKAVVSSAENVRKMAYEASVSMMLYGFSHSAAARDSFEKLWAQLPEQYDKLAEAVKDDPNEKRRMDEMKGVRSELIVLVTALKRSMDDNIDVGDFVSTVDMKRKAKRLFDSQSQLLTDIVAIEQSKGVSEESQLRLRQVMKIALACGVVFNILLALLLVSLFNKSTAARLNVLITNALRLSSTVPLLPALRGSDELGQLDKVFRDMARSMEEASRKEKAVVDNTLDLICSLDAAMQFTRANPASLACWGYEPDELIGRRLAALVYDEDVAATQKALASLR
ncbi:MAG: PAS domain-containing protein, partial [Terriglobales bacterium]